MARSLTADDIFPLVACLPPEERARLLELIRGTPGTGEGEAYRAFPPTPEEFSSSDEDPLSWEAEGWENFG